MTLLHAIIIIAIPIIVGGVTIWLVFRNVNRKYSDLFRKLAEVARQKPEGVASLVMGNDAGEKRRIVAALAGIEDVRSVDVIKAGKQRSQIRLTVAADGREIVYHVLLVSTEKSWGISEFSPVG